MRKINFRGWKVILLLVAVSIVIAYFTHQLENDTLGVLNVISWSALAFYLYKDVFKWVNHLDMSNDLTFWLSRIVALILCFIGITVGGVFISVGSAINSPINTGLGILFFGMAFLGAFMLFRTKRRYPHIYINQ